MRGRSPVPEPDDVLPLRRPLWTGGRTAVSPERAVAAGTPRGCLLPMRTSEADILIVPGWSNSGPDHWQSRWERNLPTARRIEQDDWLLPSKALWVGRIIDTVAKTARPAVLVAHSLGVAAAVHAAKKLPAGAIAGAFLVAPADVENTAAWPAEMQGHTWLQTPPGAGDEAAFAPLPLDPLPFPSVLVASSNDPYCSLERARFLAEAWGSAFVEGGNLGHINAGSGHGPWPEGLLRFGLFLKTL